MPKIYLYAEILTHIRQLTLYASLQTEKAEGTKLDVSSDKKVITVVHDGETQSLYLPTQILGTAQVTFPIEKKTEISARVQIDDEHEWKNQISDEVEAPWMAADLTNDTSIQCRSCEAIILQSGKIESWKNLPSDNWAELMDFWFCHKPHDDGQDDAEEAAKVKGFSSKSKLAIAPATGMTDLISIVLHAEDCTNVKAAETQHNPATTVLRCSNCTSMLGTTNEGEDLIRLHKSSIAVKQSDVSQNHQSYHSAIFTCAQILSLIEATSIKKFVVHCTSANEEGTIETEPLILWVFNPDIYYSCSAYDSLSATQRATTTPINGNPNNDDSSQIYDSAEPSNPESSNQPAPSTNPPPQSSHRNPNNDDISQIYGGSTNPQLVTGDLEFEIPVRPADSNTAESSHTPVESVTQTETDLPPRSHRPVTGLPSSTSISTSQAQPASTSADQNKHHLNLVHRATKIFYKPLSSAPELSATDFLDANSTSHEDLHFSNPADLAALVHTLEASTSMLPQSARQFQDWSVGLLDRYEKVPSGLGVMQENPLARGVNARDGRVTRWDVGYGAEGLYA